MASKGIKVEMASSSGPEVYEVVAYEDCPHYTFPFTRTISPFQDLLALTKLWLWLRQKHFTIVHSHTPKAGVLGLLGAFFAKVPIRMHTIAGIPWMESQGLKRILLKNVDRLAYRFATHVFANSNELLRFVLAEKLVDPKKIKVLGEGSTNGIDTNYFNPDALPETKSELRIKYCIPQNSFVFVFVGRIVGDKGMNELAKAFGELTNNSHLILVGPLEQEYDPLSPEALLVFKESPRVHLMGYQSEVRPFYKLADALVFPSYREGFPNVPMQAGAMGLPSIVTNINGCNEIIQHGENGLIVPPKKNVELLKAMNTISSDYSLCKGMSAKARKIISERYSQEKLHEHIFNEYLNAISNVR